MGRPAGIQGVKQEAEDMPAAVCVLQSETGIEKSEGFWEGVKEGVGDSPFEKARGQRPVSCKVSCDHIYMRLDN